MKNYKIARAVMMTVAGAAMSAGAASTASASTTMYNTMNRSVPFTVPTPTNGASGTDGWTKTGNQANTGAIRPWYGTAGVTAQPVLPFGYSGNQALNWAAHITAQGDSLTVSQAEANQRFGTGIGAAAFYPDLDTARGAWNDGGPPPADVGVGSVGWGHNTDFGLFKSDVTTMVTLSPSTVIPVGQETWSNFAFTIFTGMDTGAGFTHHAQWNTDYDSGVNEAPAQVSNPMGTTGLLYKTHSDSGDITFKADAGVVYSIYLGGFDGLDNWAPHAGYAVNITTAPVPVPAAVWLFGSALAGMGVIGRRKGKASQAA